MADRLYDLARRLGDEALAQARRFGADVTYAAVDSGGHLIVLMRHDLASYPTVEVARRKAATAASLKMPTHVLAEAAQRNPIMAAALGGHPDMLAVPGGFPLILDGAVRGGAGLAGAEYSEDLMFMQRALARFQAEWKPVSRPESGLNRESGAFSDAKPASTFAENAPEALAEGAR